MRAVPGVEARGLAAVLAAEGGCVRPPQGRASRGSRAAAGSRPWRVRPVAKVALMVPCALPALGSDRESPGVPGGAGCPLGREGTRSGSVGRLLSEAAQKGAHGRVTVTRYFQSLWGAVSRALCVPLVCLGGLSPGHCVPWFVQILFRMLDPVPGR